MTFLKLFTVIFIGAIVYLSSLDYGFSQDDFIHLYSSQANNLGDFLNFFNPFYHYPDIFFYRPLTTQFYFFINTFIFNLNPLPFRIENLTLHLINAILFYFLILKIWQNSKIAFVSAIFYSVSAAHFLSLYYISAFQETGRMFFILLSFLMFFSYQESKKKVFYVFSAFSFIAALLSKETSLIAPILIFPLEILRQKDQSIFKTSKSIFKLIVPFLVIAIFYLAVRVAGFQSIFNEGAYQTAFSFSKVLQNLKWYFVWSFGLPEVLSSYPSLKPSSLIRFGKDLPFGNTVLLLLICFLMICGVLLMKLKHNKKWLFASLALFLIPLLPVLVLQGHRYPQYLDLSFLGFLPILSLILLQTSRIKKVLGFIGILLFIFLQFFSIKLSEQTHWTTHRAKVASYYFETFKKNYPNLPNNSVIDFVGTKNSTKQLSFALAQKYALLVWYPNKIGRVNYKINTELETKSSVIVIPVTIY